MTEIKLKAPALVLALSASLAGPAAAETLSGAAALGDWRGDSPGVVRRITAADLPAPFASRSAGRPAAEVARPSDASLRTLPGFAVTAFAHLDHPRQIRVAPNGDIFVAESDAGRITVLRAPDGVNKAVQTTVFASHLDEPFGIAFYPAGPHPQWVYVGQVNSVVRYPYSSGDTAARAPAQVVVARLGSEGGNHVTRDLEVASGGKRILVSVGSASNLAEGMPAKSAAEIRAWEASHLTGSAWGREENRADVLSFDPEGGHVSVFASGLRNCVSLRLHPATGEPWCVVNERDGLGDDLPPDYVSRVKAGGFYGWPWYYIGNHQDPRRLGERPDLAGKAISPDVLLQPHSAPLGLAFYTAGGGPAAFPATYRGDAFVALHGSWNRSRRTGYKLVRLKLNNGVPTGAYEDFMTGFVADDNAVWGRPVGVAMAHDGALLVSDDVSGTVWRIAYSARLASER